MSDFISTPPLCVPSVYRHPSQFPTAVWDCLEARPWSSNIIHAYASQLLKGNGDHKSGQASGLWIVFWTAGTENQITSVLSCVAGPIGPYPVFIYSPLSGDVLGSTYTEAHIHSIVDALLDHVAPERVFSVFAVDATADAFAAKWSTKTGIAFAHPLVYYHANLMCCTKQTLKTGDVKVLPGAIVELRLARPSDVLKAAHLCREFAAASEPYILSEAQALQVAGMLVRNHQLWVCVIQEPGSSPDIACIVASTRTTDSIAAITKVFTNPAWRNRGCAGRLVRHVCEHLLQSKESVVLYVAHSNPAAARVYEQVGFVNVSSAPSADGSVVPESWKELGFDQDMVQLGHW
ncbi:hypothetical protein BD413DRAFT_466339 [Trametes elegans]|nr:hypothetical protein BD413DRAFT_466339 [Trametes elegans]